MGSAIEVLEKVAVKYGHQFEFEQHDIGGSSYEKHGEPLTDNTVDACLDADAILLGAIGGPKWDNIPTHLRPEQGLLKIRKALNLFANIRPIKGFAPLLHASPLKESVINGSDIYVVRELTGGLYFGTNRKSTRLNSSHVAISYAVFCLKKKKQQTITTTYNGSVESCTPPRGKQATDRYYANR